MEPNQRWRGQVLLWCSLVCLSGVATLVVGQGRYEDLVALDAEFTNFRAPRVIASVPQLEPASIEAQAKGLRAFRGRLQAMDTSSWSTGQKVDYLVVWAKLNSLEFDPLFYLYRVNRTPYVDVPLNAGPDGQSGTAAEGLVERLRAVPAILQMAQSNLSRGGAPISKRAQQSHPCLHSRTPLGWVHARWSVEPIRMIHRDSGRTEGWETYLEEMLVQAGITDDNPRARELFYIALTKRGSRIFAETSMHSGEMSLDEANEYMIDYVPFMEEKLGRYDLESYLRRPGSGSMYIIGKIQIERLISERAFQLKDAFDLGDFHDDFLSRGMIPISLIRWEMTGLEDEIEPLWAEVVGRTWNP